jgi:hypothetical protein
MGLTGQPDKPARKLIGQWLKTANDDATHVLRVLEDAGDARPADPVAWIEVAVRGGKQVRSDDPAFMWARP